MVSTERDREKKAAGNTVICEGDIKLHCVLLRTQRNLCSFSSFGGISCLHLQGKVVSIFLQIINIHLPQNTVSEPEDQNTQLQEIRTDTISQI